MKLLVVVPLQEELDAFLQPCIQGGCRVEPAAAGRLPMCRLPDLGLTLACGGLGKVQFAVQTRYLLDTDGPWDMAVCAGAAGALVDDLAIGDVVVATRTIEHDIRNRFGPPRLPHFTGDARTLTEFQRLSSSFDRFRLYLGPVASGDEDVVDRDRRQVLHEGTGALVVAWEGAGGARACAFSDTPFLEIRGVTDAANRDAPGQFQDNLGLAMAHVATAVMAWVGSRRTACGD